MHAGAASRSGLSPVNVQPPAASYYWRPLLPDHNQDRVISEKAFQTGWTGNNYTTTQPRQTGIQNNHTNR